LGDCPEPRGRYRFESYSVKHLLKGNMDKFDFFSKADRKYLTKVMCKALERICGDDDLKDISFRVELLDVQHKIEEILKKFDEQADGKRYY
jgi:hypothetical protein